MAFAETRSSNRVVRGDLGVQVLCYGNVFGGDCLAIDGTYGNGNTWNLSASATAEQPLLIASNQGSSGDTITAYPLAIVEVVTTSSNVATVGEKVGVADDGSYAADSAGAYPDVGHVASIGSDSLSAILFLCPMGAQLVTLRA